MSWGIKKGAEWIRIVVTKSGKHRNCPVDWYKKLQGLYLIPKWVILCAHPLMTKLNISLQRS
jgi:hypothetical protein